jgi:hypothetical protein
MGPLLRSKQISRLECKDPRFGGTATKPASDFTGANGGNRGNDFFADHADGCFAVLPMNGARFVILNGVKDPA